MPRRVAALFAALACAAAATAQPAAPAPDARSANVKVVMFTARWCPNCRVLEPKLAAALGGVGGAQRIDIDITNAATWDASLERALDLDIVRLYNAYVGTTGFAVIAAADTGETIACVNASFEAATIRSAIERAQRRVRETPPHRRAAGRDMVCPDERPPPPPA